MKVFGCWICYNNIRTLPYSVASIYNLIDELVLVDGSFKKETSTDGTWEYLEALKSASRKPVHIIKSQATTLFDKHNEHVAVTGNNNPSVWTWQVDSDEIYSEKQAIAVKCAIDIGRCNGIIVKLINIERFEDGKFFASPNIERADTNQMRIYRMCNGLTFKSKDGTFEWIVYGDRTDVQRQNNKICADSKNLRVDHYHCLATLEQAIARYSHYGEMDPEATARSLRQKENTTLEIPNNVLTKMLRSDTFTNARYYESLVPFV